MSTPHVHIVGGGVAGLAAASFVKTLALTFKLAVSVTVYDERFGGSLDDLTAAPRSALWLHSGVNYVQNQPHVVLTLQRSVAWLELIAPHAIHRLLTLYIAPRDSVPVREFLEVLEIPYKPVSTQVATQWLPRVRFNPEHEIFRVHDATLDLTVLSAALIAEARRVGVTLVSAKVKHLDTHGEVVKALVLADGTRVPVSTEDQVVLANGARVIGLLSQLGMVVEGLRRFKCLQIASPAFGLPALLIMNRGIDTEHANCIPHHLADGTPINLFGDAQREAFIDGDDLAFINSDTFDQLLVNVEKAFGLSIPRDSVWRWNGVKTEFIPTDATRSQAHFTRRVAANLWVLLPGKLSNVAEAGRSIATLLCGQLSQQGNGLPIAEPIFNHYTIPQPDTLAVG